MPRPGLTVKKLRPGLSVEPQADTATVTTPQVQPEKPPDMPLLGRFATSFHAGAEGIRNALGGLVGMEPKETFSNLDQMLREQGNVGENIVSGVGMAAPYFTPIGPAAFLAGLLTKPKETLTGMADLSAATTHAAYGRGLGDIIANMFQPFANGEPEAKEIVGRQPVEALMNAAMIAGAPKMIMGGIGRIRGLKGKPAVKSAPKVAPEPMTKIAPETAQPEVAPSVAMDKTPGKIETGIEAAGPDRFSVMMQKARQLGHNRDNLSRNREALSPEKISQLEADIAQNEADLIGMGADPESVLGKVRAEAERVNAKNMGYIAEKYAGNLGIKYNGLQEGIGKVKPVHLFTDSETGSTFSVPFEHPDKVGEYLAKKRAEMTKPAPPVEAAVPKTGTVEGKIAEAQGAIGDIKGKTLTHAEVTERAKTVAPLESVIGREKTLEIEAATKAANDVLFTIAEQEKATPGVSADLIKQLQSVSSVGTFAGRLLESRKIGAEQRGEMAPITKKEFTARLATRLDETANAAMARIKARSASVSLGSGPLHELPNAVDFVIVGASKIGKGTIKFADWSTAMLKDFGDDIRPYLQSLYAESKKHFAREKRAVGISVDDPMSKASMVDDLLKLGHSADEILKKSEGIDFTDMNQARKFYREIEKSTFSRMLQEFRYGNMLSSPSTHAVNIGSNALQALGTRPAVLLVNGMVDPIASAIKPKYQRQYYIKSIPAYYRGAFGNLGFGLEKAFDALRGHYTIERPDLPRIESGAKVMKPWQYVLRTLEAQDLLFRTMMEGGESEVIALARQRGRDISDIQAKTEARTMARDYIFRSRPEDQRGILANQIKYVERAAYNLQKIPVVGWMAPFIQTPANILRWGVIDLTPAGYINMIKHPNKVEAFSRATLGSTVMLGAGYLALNDRLTWKAPRGEKERQEFYDQGKQPYAFRITGDDGKDTYMSYSRMGAFAYPVAIAAAIKHEWDDDPKNRNRGTAEKIARTLGGIAEFFSDQSFVDGMGNIMALGRGEPGAWKETATNLGQQVIPFSSLQRNVARVVDPIFRKPKAGYSLESYKEIFMKDIPGLSKQLESYKTPSGQPSRIQYPWQYPLSPIRVSRGVSKTKTTRPGLSKPGLTPLGDK